ncbi:chemotaxis protein CheW [Synechocystis sp. PCC 7339]|uniref:CheW domain-containing protein n=1 Tax=unclassified Synechocystis TaxID=2640012 RepID=UPI001BB0B517|nr:MULTISPECIES: chemotaxis protein CheW [unclassified Synechocystis]QUS60191.1 chemotaxis protein CheW [Synechocystis sp. PCC 7338]UAJ72364.1 chemotaxis protein CheW [Synechocystis sp. PCC 7339]
MVEDYFWIDLGLALTVAIPLTKTREVLSFSLSSLCLIPGVRPELLGVSNQRGNLLWVMDLPRLLSPATAKPLNYRTLNNTKAVVLVGESAQVAAIAEGLKGIVSFEPGEIKPLREPFLLGEGNKDGETILILDVDQIFAWLQGGGFIKPLYPLER